MPASSSRLARTILPRLPRQFPHRPRARLPPFLPILGREPAPFHRTPILLRNRTSSAKLPKWLKLEDDLEAEEDAPTVVNWENLAGAEPRPPTKPPPSKDASDPESERKPGSQQKPESEQKPEDASSLESWQKLEDASNLEAEQNPKSRKEAQHPSNPKTKPKDWDTKIPYAVYLTWAKRAYPPPWEVDNPEQIKGPTQKQQARVIRRYVELHEKELKKIQAKLGVTPGSHEPNEKVDAYMQRWERKRADVEERQELRRREKAKVARAVEAKLNYKRMQRRLRKQGMLEEINDFIQLGLEQDAEPRAAEEEAPKP